MDKIEKNIHCIAYELKNTSCIYQIRNIVNNKGMKNE